MSNAPPIRLQHIEDLVAIVTAEDLDRDLRKRALLSLIELGHALQFRTDALRRRFAFLLRNEHAE